MAKLTHLLSDIQIRAWMAKGEPIARSDGDGLTFTLSNAGTATWVLRYRIGNGRRRELTIGNYPDISLAAAREKARAARVAIDEGRDPAVEKQEEKTRIQAAWTVRELVANYREKCLLPAGLAQETIDYRNRDYDQVILPYLGARQIQRVTSIDIVSMMTDCNRKWSASKRLLTSVSQLFDHACGLKIIPANPCTGIKLSAIKGPRPPIRRRVMLLEEELRQLLPDIDLIGTENALAFRILLATCVRGIELAKAKKEHVYLDRAVWWVPDESVKTRKGFLVPLTPPVIEWFRRLIELSGESIYVLPARHERRRRNQGCDTHVCQTTLWAAIRRAFDRHDLEIRRFTPHDTRSTAKGHMRNMGVSREISELALNHTLKGMEAIYDVREEIPERREALERWTAFLCACESGAPTPEFVKGFRNSNVIPMLSVA
ncbi:integrase [Burkholderiaceae bacterium 26]|nr:integrase [Burkholderiaceae bacterium 26]